MTTAIEKFKDVAAFLKNSGIEDAAKEAEMLITEALHISKARLYTESIVISEDISTQINTLVLRRAKGEPIQYIIGHVDFYGLKINVGEGVLIPRPETELLGRKTIKILMSYGLRVEDKENSKFKILDLCTGSGCIAIALAKHFPVAEVYGVDISDIAIEYAIKNVKENNVGNAHFIKNDLFCIVGDSPESTTPIGVRNSGTVPLHTLEKGGWGDFQLKFDCIVSNPPYIKRADIPKNAENAPRIKKGEQVDAGKIYRV